MNFLEFIATIVASIVWPLTLVGLVVWGRPYLVRLPDLIKSAKYKDLEVTFRDRLDVIESDAESAGLEIPSDLPQEYRELFRNNTERLHIVVIEAWAMVERALRSKLQPGVLTYAGSIIRLTQSLYRQGVLSEEEFSLLREFQLARNRAVHEEIPNLTEAEVLKFLKISAALIERIKKTPPAKS